MKYDKEEGLEYLGIKIRSDDPPYVNEFSSKLLNDYYVKDGENISQALARAATAYCFGDYELAQRIYDYAYNGWFMFASPVLSNAPKGRWTSNHTHYAAEFWGEGYDRNSCWVGKTNNAMPISCFLLTAPDTIVGQMDTQKEIAALSISGGGIGLHNQIRAASTKAPGPIPYMKVVDSAIGYYRQSVTRRGACAWYMDVSHPDIMEHIRFRVPSGGDSARKADNRSQFHSAVNLTDEFISAVVEDGDFALKCPHSGEIREWVKARKIWEAILETRALTGEPYIFKTDTEKRSTPKTQLDRGLVVNGSNLCSEVTLPTNDERTAVCCLSSLNLEYYDEWKDTTIVEDLVRFLDNVLQYFIDRAPADLKKAVYSAKQERSIGLGVMGWHYYLQKHGIPFEGGGFGSAVQHTNIIFNSIQQKAINESLALGRERGECPDMEGTGRRNARLLAIAPTSNNSIILGTSPSVEPISSNAYTHSTRAGTFLVKNKYLEEILKGINDDPKWLEDQWQSIVKNSGSVQHLEYLTDEQKAVYKTAFELDQHWVVEQADQRQKYICQAQSINLFFPAGVDAAYFNSVHLKAIKAEYLKTLYYCRMSREVKVDVVKEIERKALVDWSGDECVACQG